MPDRVDIRSRNATRDLARILATAQPIEPGARVADEILIFLFRLTESGITIADFSSLLDPVGVHDFLGQVSPGEHRSIRDAEKALIHVLQPNQNDQKYLNYPRSADGLHDQGLTHFSIGIAEALTFYTDHGRLHGTYDPLLSGLGNFDRIVVRDGTLTLVRHNEE
ncbi:MAG: hypothetical protein ABI282_08475 [Candidatus Baltobacteraceae bacterium]